MAHVSNHLRAGAEDRRKSMKHFAPVVVLARSAMFRTGCPAAARPVRFFDYDTAACSSRLKVSDTDVHVVNNAAYEDETGYFFYYFYFLSCSLSQTEFQSNFSRSEPTIFHVQRTHGVRRPTVRR
jgi:hypothetical protein